MFDLSLGTRSPRHFAIDIWTEINRLNSAAGDHFYCCPRSQSSSRAETALFGVMHDAILNALNVRRPHLALTPLDGAFVAGTKCLPADVGMDYGVTGSVETRAAMAPRLSDQRDRGRGRGEARVGARDRRRGQTVLEPGRQPVDTARNLPLVFDWIAIGRLSALTRCLLLSLSGRISDLLVPLRHIADIADVDPSPAGVGAARQRGMLMRGHATAG